MDLRIEAVVRSGITFDLMICNPMNWGDVDKGRRCRAASLAQKNAERQSRPARLATGLAL